MIFYPEHDSALEPREDHLLSRCKQSFDCTSRFDSKVWPSQFTTKGVALTREALSSAS